MAKSEMPAPVMAGGPAVLDEVPPMEKRPTSAADLAVMEELNSQPPVPVARSAHEPADSGLHTWRVTSTLLQTGGKVSGLYKADDASEATRQHVLKHGLSNARCNHDTQPATAKEAADLKAAYELQVEEANKRAGLSLQK